MLSDPIQQKVPSDKIVVISNVRTELPDIDGLKTSILASGGIIQPLIGYNIGENVEVLKVEIPKQKKKVSLCSEALGQIDPSESPVEFENAELALERERNLLKIMEDDYKAMKDIPADHVRIIDGHRRFSAGLSAGISDFNFTLYTPVPNPVQVMFTQFTTGVEKKEITHLDQGRFFRKLMRMGYSQKHISNNVGTKACRATILHKTKILELFERAESIGSELSFEFCSEVEKDNVPVTMLIKMSQYHDMEGITDANMEEMFSWALSGDYTGDSFVKAVNNKFGRRDVITPTTGGGKTGKDDQDQGAGDGKTAKKRPEKEIRYQRDKWDTMLSLAEEDRKKKGDSSQVSEEDIEKLKWFRLGIGYSLGDPVPPVPDSMEKVSVQLDAQHEEERKILAAQTKKAKDSQRAVDKEVKKKENEERAAVRKYLKDKEQTAINPIKKKIETYVKQIETNKKRLEEEDLDEKTVNALKRKIFYAETTKSSFEEDLRVEYINLQSKKPDWYIEEEEKARKREEEKAKANSGDDKKE